MSSLSFLENTGFMMSDLFHQSINESYEKFFHPFLVDEVWNIFDSLGSKKYFLNQISISQELIKPSIQKSVKLSSSILFIKSL